MTRILIISNYKKAIGGISGQVEILLEKFNTEHITSNLFNTKMSNFKRMLLPFKLYFQRNSYDIFHIHGSSHLGFFPIIIGVLVGTISKKYIIVTYHGGELKKFLNSYPKMVKYFLRRADILTVPSDYLLTILKNDNVDAIHLPNIIREDNIEFKERSKFYPSFIVTRSLEKIYNIPLVIRAFSQLKGTYKEAKLFIVGDGSLKKELQNEVDKSKIEGIEFVGRVDNSEIGRVLNRADIYINPTTADNMPLSLFEAFACGLPVISTNVGGLPDFITDNENGFLIDSNDSNALIEKVDFILLNQDKVKPIIDNARRTFQKYTWESLREEYFELYKL